jgi:cysteine desulfurase
MKVYLDNAATTRVDPLVLKVMLPFFRQKFGNPSSAHLWGQEAREAADRARAKIGFLLGANPQEIVFTSCATESINLAHKGLVEALLWQNAKRETQNEKPHIVTTAIEHKAVLEACHHLEKAGLAEVTFLGVDRYGMVGEAEIKKAMKPNTVLVSVMYVNNEVGTIEPIEKIGRLLEKENELRMKRGEQRVYFHTDATQAVQYLSCRVDKLGVDLLSLTGHKFQAPKGIGALYVREKTPLLRQLDGGGQETKRRAGTENVAFIVAITKALEMAKVKSQKSKLKIERLRDRLIEGILKIPGVDLTGHPEKRAPHIASFAIRGVEGEALLMLLSDEGVAASSGSACTSGSLKASHVLTAMGILPEVAHGSLRLSLGRETTEKEIDYVLAVLPKIVAKLRRMAPRL